MPIFIILLTLLLVSCQIAPTGSNSDPANKNKSTRTRQDSSTSNIFSRYKSTNNRYTIAQDGAPKNSKKISFKEPSPKKEPLSRYGNPTEYYVDGRKYQVMKSSSGYKTTGTASWYGKKFHKQRTSSGEAYNMYVMTAAHKTLPLPSYVKVTNLENNKVAVVRVNDRGPFHVNRVIDLSYAAAVKLGVYPKGTAHVQIETLAGSASGVHYYVQAGAFSSELFAKQLQKKLTGITPSPVYIEHYQRHYVVRVGPFATRYMADSLKNKLKSSGVSGAFSLLI